MALNLYQDKLKNQLVKDIKLLKKFATESRSDQTIVLTYGTITLNGNTGEIVIKDGSNNTIVLLNTSGLTVKAIGTGATKYLLFKDLSGNNVGTFVYRRYTSGTSEVSDFAMRTILGSINEKNGYVTMDIWQNDETTRSLFFQISEAYNSSGVFTRAELNFAKHGNPPSFAVEIIDTSGNGYIKLPHNASDPSPVYSGCLYYNTTSSKIRKYNEETWSDV